MRATLRASRENYFNFSIVKEPTAMQTENAREKKAPAHLLRITLQV